MLKQRIIACLDVEGDTLVKGVHFKNLQRLGDPLPRALAYEEQGIDELVIYEIGASAEGRKIAHLVVERIARAVSIPLCVAGGIRTLKDAEAILALGVDKISINSAAIQRPELISEIAEEFGSQCVVVGVDCSTKEGQSQVFLYAGRSDLCRPSGKNTAEWVQEIADRGAGEVVVNSIDRDGTSHGYDLDLLSLLRPLTPIPLIASGGARIPQHFYDVFTRAQVDGALLAGALHRGEIQVADIKNHLRSKGVPVR